MLVTMLTAMYMMVQVVEQVGLRWGRQPAPLPYMLAQPIPWQIHSVSSSRRGSRAEERRNSAGMYRKNSNCTNGLCAPASPEAVKAAFTIQKEYRKYQQKKKDTV
ncbi:uncharacterized protein LOC122133177 [Clupea harengus]|uniref:Uncharacterized protein LOC122133177 n=1 Tax=Clupea harengus TaxID=7950 RepID=A0A8M1KSR6_CLUHA|nr:uncharacterized protein LOC122133177 [Clupea harengus]